MIGIALLMATAIMITFTLWPLFRRSHSAVTVSESDTPLGRLRLRKDILLGNINDLDFEYSMGKIADGDYESLRETLKRQASLILEQIQVLQSPEAVMASASVATPQAGSSARGATQFCTQCGSKLPVQAKFCPGCGSKVVA